MTDKEVKPKTIRSVQCSACGNRHMGLWSHDGGETVECPTKKVQVNTKVVEAVFEPEPVAEIEDIEDWKRKTPPLEDAQIPKPIAILLRDNGYEGVDISTVSDEDLLAISGIGQAGLKKIRETV